MTLVLSRSDLERLVDTDAAIHAVETGLRDVARGDALQPTPFRIPTGSSTTSYLTMAAAHIGRELVVAKLLADVPSNRDRALPAQRSVVILSSSADGAPLAVLDGRVPTRERTAATTAVATRALSRADSRVLGLIGAGGLAEPHVRAIRRVRPIERVMLWSRSRASARERAQQLATDGLAVEVVDEPEEVAARSDIVCTLTPSREPVLRGAWLRPGTHVNAVGAPPRPDHRELDTDAVVAATIFVDDVPTALHDSGEIVSPISEGRLSPDDLAGTVGEVLAGLHPGRTDDNEITLFNSVGLGVEDLAICAAYVERAQALGVGTTIELNQ